MNCKDCRHNENSHNGKEHGPVPWIICEDYMLLCDKREKRHWIIHIISFIVILAIVGAFIWYLNQYDFSSTEETYTVDVSSDDGGNVNYIGRDGDINNGAG